MSFDAALESGLAASFARASLEDNAAHYGPCIQLTVRNESKRPIRTKLTAGTWLLANNESEQNLLVTEDRLLALMPGAERKYPIMAMCGEANDAAPSSTSTFTYWGTANDTLVALAELLDRNDWQDDAGQAAVWVLTDQRAIGSIESNNEYQRETLRRHCARALGLTYAGPGKEREARFILPKPVEDLRSGEVWYRLRTPANVSVGIQDGSGAWAETFVYRKYQPAGEHRFAFTVAVHQKTEGPFDAVVEVDGEIRERRRLPD